MVSSGKLKGQVQRAKIQTTENRGRDFTEREQRIEGKKNKIHKMKRKNRQTDEAASTAGKMVCCSGSGDHCYT